jgi:hypothetical protein
LKNLVLRRAACFGGGSGGLCPLEGVFLKDPRKKRQSVEGLEEFFNGLLDPNQAADDAQAFA